MTDTTTTMLVEYQPHRARLEELRAQYAGAKWNTETKTGMAIAKEARKEIRGFRRQLEETKKIAKEKALAHCKAVDAEYHAVDDAAAEMLEPCDAAIKEVEQRAKREAEAAQRQEDERQQRCREEIDRIRSVPVNLVGAPMDAIEASGVALETLDLGWLAEFQGIAMKARDEAVEKLRAMYREAKARGDEEKRLAAERAELDRLRAEQSKRDAEERARLAKEQESERQRLAEERRRLDEEQRAARAAREKADAEARAARERADAEARKAREAEENRIRIELEKINAARREQEEKERHARLGEQMKLDGRELLRAFVDRYGDVEEFRAVAAAISHYLSTVAA